jgi:hypothetical protein
MKNLREKWHKMSTNQQILASIIITFLLLMIAPYAIVYLIPVLAFVLILGIPILLTWCLITMVIGKKGE